MYGRAPLLSLDCSTLLLIRTLYCWMLSKEVSTTTFWDFRMTRPGIEHRSLGSLANTLPTRSMREIEYFNCKSYYVFIFINLLSKEKCFWPQWESHHLPVSQFSGGGGTSNLHRILLGYFEKKITCDTTLVQDSKWKMQFYSWFITKVHLFNVSAYFKVVIQHLGGEDCLIIQTQ